MFSASQWLLAWISLLILPVIQPHGVADIYDSTQIQTPQSRNRVQPKEFPHMALLGYGNADNIRWTAVGTLISDRFVLAAAHVLNYRPGPIGEVRWVRLGDINVYATTDDSRPQTLEVIQRIPHPNFQAPSLYNDIGILRLNATVQISDWVQPACVYTNASTPAHRLAILTGWGRNDRAETRRKFDLAKLRVRFEPNEKCNNSFGRVVATSKDRLSAGFTEDSMICAGDPCIGENGGPLQLEISSPDCKYSIVGITSFGPVMCGQADGVASYTRISYYAPWINSIILPKKDE